MLVESANANGSVDTVASGSAKSNVFDEDRADSPIRLPSPSTSDERSGTHASAPAGSPELSTVSVSVLRSSGSASSLATPLSV